MLIPAVTMFIYGYQNIFSNVLTIVYTATYDKDKQGRIFMMLSNLLQLVYGRILHHWVNNAAGSTLWCLHEE